jgi:AMP deaminase
VYSGPVRSYCHKHLELLLSLFNMHALLNLDRESVESKGCGGRDFYNVRKVDTHVHHSACMGERHLLTFMRNKLLNHSHDIVLQKSGKSVTLGDVFSSLGLTVPDLSIDTLDMHAHNTFQRFDRFNLKYNPAGQSSLREIFLKTDNFISGRYLAEMTREVMDVLTEQRYTICEWRISIYGKSNEEWKALARWFYTHRLAHENVRWLIQIPRRFEQFRKDNSVENFEQFLKNIFQPLVEATLDPSGDIALSYFMDAVVGFDTVDDESQPESGSINSLSAAAALPLPRDWTAPDNPPYSYWLYYLHANISVLNQLRQIRGMSAFSFRPHCGEAGDADHLLAAYLVAHEINHGINLKKLPGLHFLFYLSQVGIAMSPISNNRLFLDYNKNPFPTFFRQGLNVSLSTDDPLLLHSTSDPLVEEYSVAAQVYRLSPTDLCEIARNRQSINIITIS